MSDRRVIHSRDPSLSTTREADAPPAVRVRCTSQQASLETGQPCGWSGSRVGYAFERRDGTTARTNPARKRCPRCGSRVELAHERN